MKLKVFVDFDGTITTEDVGNAFFAGFGGPKCAGLVREYREGRLTAVQCFRAEAAAMRTFSRHEADEFIRSRAIDPSFRTFAAFCRSREIGLFVVSDGLDYYIRQILSLNGLDDIAVIANHAMPVPVGNSDACTLDVQFPWTNAECHRCACCKRDVMLTRAGDDEVVVYIGDGYSDRCPVRYADVVFARGELQTFCQQENISYYLYASFADVPARLTKLLGAKRFRKPLRAEQMRRDAFVAE